MSMNRNEERSLTGAAPAAVNSRYAVTVIAGTAPDRLGNPGRLRLMVMIRTQATDPASPSRREAPESESRVTGREVTSSRGHGSTVYTTRKIVSESRVGPGRHGDSAAAGPAGSLSAVTVTRTVTVPPCWRPRPGPGAGPGRPGDRGQF